MSWYIDSVVGARDAVIRVVEERVADALAMLEIRGAPEEEMRDLLAARGQILTAVDAIDFTEVAPDGGTYLASVEASGSRDPSYTAVEVKVRRLKVFL